MIELHIQSDQSHGNIFGIPKLRHKTLRIDISDAMKNDLLTYYDVKKSDYNILFFSFRQNSGMITIATDDDLQAILSYVEICDMLMIKKVCKKFYNYWQSQHIISLLSLKLDMTNASLERLILKYQINMRLPILNMLVVIHLENLKRPILLCDLENEAVHKLTIWCDWDWDDFLNTCLKAALKSPGKVEVSVYDQYEHYQVSDVLDIGHYFEVTINFKHGYLRDQYDLIIGYKTVVLNLQDTKLTPLAANYESDQSLPFMSDCLWIKINRSSKQVTISPNIKSNSLTLKDILHVTMSLSEISTHAERYRYTIVNETETQLTLKLNEYLDYQ